MTQKRASLLSLDWFKEGRQLAIADVVYVEGVGLCSHQPKVDEAFSGYRLQDQNGKIHIITNDKLLFLATTEEIKAYWSTVRQQDQILL